MGLYEINVILWNLKICTQQREQSSESMGNLQNERKIFASYSLDKKLLSRITSEEIKSICNRDTHFYSSIIHIAKLWNHSSCPSTDEWIKKMWYIYTKHYYLVIWKNEIMLFARK
jgi:hypothetical protein